VAKVYGHYITVNYRESYGLFAVSGILFNHESRPPGTAFRDAPVTNGAARVARLARELRLATSTPSATGFAGDHVEAMWMMLQQSAPDDYVIAIARRTACAAVRSRSPAASTGGPRRDGCRPRAAGRGRFADRRRRQGARTWLAPKLSFKSRRDDGGRRPKNTLSC
jgi:hypothetical protein